jgi:hypothetical protein
MNTDAAEASIQQNIALKSMALRRSPGYPIGRQQAWVGGRWAYE